MIQREKEADQSSVSRRIGMLRPDSIRIKILVLAVLATLLPSLATAWISYLENERSLTAKATEELSSLSGQAARELYVWAREMGSDLRVFASSYEVTENMGARTTRSEAAHRRVADYLTRVDERFADYSDLLILDPNGRVIVSSGERHEAIALPEDWQARLRVDEFVVGVPYWDEVNLKPGVFVAVPILVAGERFPGTLTAELDLTLLGATLAQYAPGEGGRVSLLAPDGSIVASSHGDSAEIMKPRYPPETIRTQLNSNGSTVEFTNLAGEQVLGSVRRVPGLDWAIVAELRVDEVYRQLARVRNVTLLIVAVTALLAGGVGYALGLVIVRPLDHLTRAAARVAGGNLDVDLAVTNGGEVGYLTEVFNDMVRRLRSSQEQLKHLSVTDPLTGLDNRRRMMEALHNEVLRSRRLEHTFAVLMVDVDHFKAYNDAYGHPAGDEVLKNLALALRAASRDVDSIARYGGEEFFVLMPETRAPDAAQLANRVREQLAKQLQGSATVTLSVGVAEFPTHAETGEDVIRAADTALYEAKRSGRDRVVVARGAERAKVAHG